jgi:hypothetical protein
MPSHRITDIRIKNNRGGLKGLLPVQTGLRVFPPIKGKLITIVAINTGYYA